jgi:ABC-type antimicrobial peptide transport system permease subunit
VAILLAGLGLLGLASFMAERRRREIGIRKVLGASVSGLFHLLTREFVVLVLVSMAVAAPVSWLFMHRWLGRFEYSSGIGWAPFVITAVVLSAATYLTVGYQSVRAALANPTDSLRSE